MNISNDHEIFAMTSFICKCARCENMYWLKYQFSDSCCYTNVYDDL